MSKSPKNPNDATRKEDDFSSIPKSVLNLVAKFATEKAIEIFEQKLEEQRKKTKDYRLKNTRLLIKKYRWLSSFAGNAVSELTQLLTEEDIALLESMGLESAESRRVESIKDRVIFTNTVMGHIDTMLDCYKRKCMASGKEDIQRRWRVLYAMYIAETPTTAEDIADREHISDRMIYRDLNAAILDLSGLFFGLDLSDILLIQ